MIRHDVRMSVILAKRGLQRYVGIFTFSLPVHLPPWDFKL